MDGKGKNNELINHIAERLRNHTEPYREGAWERFSAQTGGRSKRGIGWLQWSAAAVLLVTAGWMLFNWPQEELNIVQQVSEQAPATVGEQPAVKEKSAEEQIASSPVIDDKTSRDVPQSAALKKAPRTAVPIESSRTVKSDSAEPVMARAATADTTLLARVAEPVAGASNSAHEEQPKTDVTEDTGVDRSPPEQLVANEPVQPGWEVNGRSAYPVHTMEKAASERADKWDLGIALAPSVTSERLNIGGGLAVAYRLSDKFSLASGVSLSDLGVAQQQIGEPLTPQASFAPNSPAPGHVPEPDNSPYRYREITSVTSTLLALDIPLNLRYHVTKRFYTSAGVSFIGILNERRTNHFVDHINQPTDYANNLTAVHSTARSDEQPLQGKGYTGFFNFSVGRSIPLSKKLFISVEPYFKLPIGRLSQEDMDLTNGGIRIVTGF